jgi:hypothetical protein
MSSLPQPDAGFALALLHEVKNEPWTLILQLWIILFVGLSPILILFILFILLRWIAANTEKSVIPYIYTLFDYASDQKQ